MRIRLRPLPVLTVASTLALALLLWLGHWQWSRFEQKRLLASAPPPMVTLAPFTPAPEGRQLVFGVADGVAGWRVFEPVRHGQQIVFVDTGFAPGTQPPDWRTIQPSRVLATAPSVSGEVVRPHARNPLEAHGDPARRIWYRADLQGMARAAGLADVEPYYIALPYLDAAGQPHPNPFASAAQLTLPPERHLGYAITWWGLAAALIGMYLTFHARLGRLTFR